MSIGGILFLIFVFFAIGILSTVFWFMMIIHAAKHNIENKTVWVIVIVLTGIIGALIYYFVVKREFDSQLTTNTQPKSTPASDNSTNTNS